MYLICYHFFFDLSVPVFLRKESTVSIPGFEAFFFADEIDELLFYFFKDFPGLGGLEEVDFFNSDYDFLFSSIFTDFFSTVFDVFRLDFFFNSSSFIFTTYYSLISEMIYESIKFLIKEGVRYNLLSNEKLIYRFYELCYKNLDLKSKFYFIG